MWETLKFWLPAVIPILIIGVLLGIGGMEACKHLQKYEIREKVTHAR